MVKGFSSAVSASRVVPVFLMERSMLVSAAWRETLRVRARHRRIPEQSGRKEKERICSI